MQRQLQQTLSFDHNYLKIVKIWPGGYPQGGQKIEFGTKMAQDAAKSGFKEALEASWGRLGRPKREPREAKIEVGWVFFRA